MLEKTITQQELVGDFPAAVEAAQEHAVFVTKDGDPAYVLLSIENYDRIVHGDVTAYEAFSRNGLSGEAADYNFAEAAAEHDGVARVS